MTKEEMLQEIKDAVQKGMQGQDPTYDVDYKKILENPKIEKKTLDGYGGEGQGEDLWVVIELFDKDTKETILMFKAEGSYESWNGSDWSYASVYEVEPREVVVTKYFRV